MARNGQGWQELFDLCVRLLAARSSGHVLDQLLEGAISMLGADRGYLVESMGGQLAFRRRWGARPEAPGEPVSRAIVADALQTPVPVVVENASIDPRYALRESVRMHDLHSVIAARLGTEENVVLYLESRRTIFGAEHLEWFERLLRLSDAAVERSAERSLLRSARELYERFELAGMVVRDELMVDLLSRAGRLARAEHPVLIQGPTGAGKELVGAFLHNNSPRREAECVTVNCAALPADLIESTLFGHVRGAFTGASAAQIGMARRAHGGTLILDEVAELPLPQQAKLLRLIDNGEIQPVGGAVQKVDVRFVASTHQDLERAVADGHFRADLYYRINVVQLQVPALRERPDDLLPLFDFFLERECQRLQCDPPELDDEVVAHLASYEWPGNVRELLSVAQRVAISDSPRVRLEDLPSSASSSPRLRPLEPLVETEKAEIQRHLQHHDFVLAAAARSLGLSREGLRQKMRRLGVARFG